MTSREEKNVREWRMAKDVAPRLRDMNIPESDTSPPGRTMLSLLLSPTEAWVLRDLLEEIAKGSSTSASIPTTSIPSTPSPNPR
jgi:hypothetical protein